MTDAEVIAAVRGLIWDAMNGREIGGDRTLVGMVKRLIADRDEARGNRRVAEADLRRYAEALMLAWGGVCPPTWAVDPTDQMLMAERIRARGDELQASERDLANSVTRLEFERDEARRQRDDLLTCLRRMCGMYGAYSRRLAPLLAEDNGTVWTFERANELALEAIAKVEGK